jgi:hypothetical protein
MKTKKIFLASAMAFFLMSCGGPKVAVKSLTPVAQPQAQVAVAAKDVNLSVESNREIVMPIVENAKPNPVKLVSFVNVDDLADLTPGMTKQEVYAKLGKKPFDVISTQGDGYSIVLYKYRKVHTILNDQNENIIGAAGEKEYGTKIQDMYIAFNKDGRLELVISKDDLENANNLLKLHGRLYGLTINGGKLFIKPIM